MPIYDWNKDEMDDPDLAEKIIKAAKEEIISKKCQKIK